MFYPLYPIGIGAEWWLLYRAAEPAGKINGAIPPFFYFCLLLYVPGKFAWSMIVEKGRMLSCERLVEDVHIHDQAEEEDTRWTKEDQLNVALFHCQRILARVGLASYFVCMHRNTNWEQSCF